MSEFEQAHVMSTLKDLQNENKYHLHFQLNQLKCIVFNECVQCMPPSLVTAIGTPVEYFARVEDQQKWSEKYKIQDKISYDYKWKLRC